MRKYIILVDVLCIALVMLCIAGSYCMVSYDGKPSGVGIEYRYHDLNEAVLASNRGSLNYFIESASDNDSVFLSPLAVQSSLYSICGKDSPYLFEYFDNGYDSWVKSSQLFDEKSFITIFPNTVFDSNQLLGKLGSLTDDNINCLSKELSFDENTVFSVFSYNAVLENGRYDKSKDTVFVSGDISHKVSDTYEAVKLQCIDKDYAVYLIKGSLKDFSFDGFKNENLVVHVKPFIWQTVGSVDNLLECFQSSGVGLRVIHQFGFNPDSYSSGRVKNKDIEFKNNYHVILVNEKSELILGVGSLAGNNRKRR